MQPPNPNREDYQFETYEPLDMTWVINEDTGKLRKHTKEGYFTLTISETQDGMPQTALVAAEDGSSVYLGASALAMTSLAALIV